MDVISIPKNARLIRAGAKSRPLAFRSPGSFDCRRALCQATCALGQGSPRRKSKVWTQACFCNNLEEGVETVSHPLDRGMGGRKP